jgi:hypothetical protein
MGWVVNDTSRPIYPPKRDPVLIVQDVWAPEPDWTGAENLALMGLRSPDLRARSKSAVMPH